MFTVGLELLTCAAELSGPTCFPLERCLGGEGGCRGRSVLLRFSGL